MNPFTTELEGSSGGFPANPGFDVREDGLRRPRVPHLGGYQVAAG